MSDARLINIFIGLYSFAYCRCVLLRGEGCSPHLAFIGDIVHHSSSRKYEQVTVVSSSSNPDTIASEKRDPPKHAMIPY